MNKSETILEINKINDNRTINDEKHWLGYEIVTTEQTISFVIYNSSCCCEVWGTKIKLPSDAIGSRIF